MNKDLITNIVVGDIDFTDYPDFSDAFISEAYYYGKKLSDEQFDKINKDKGFVYMAILRYLW